MKPSVRVLVGAALSTAILCSGACGVASSIDDKPDPAKPNVAASDRPAIQESLDAAARQLQKLSHEDGYGGLSYDLDSRSINFWWKGELDPAARATIDGVRKDVTVNVLAANYSRSELGAAINRIAGTKADDGSYVVQSVEEEDLQRPTFKYGLIVIAKLGANAHKDDVESTLTKSAGLPVTLSDEGMPDDSVFNTRK
ncbi:MAG: hypothetical protein ACJ72L_17200 [Marmoricola sp.]